MTAELVAGKSPRISPRGRVVSPDCLGRRPVAPAALLLAAALTTTSLPVWQLASRAQAKVASEYEIKAAFLYNFAKFVEWPPSAFADPKQPLAICVFGHDPFGRALEEALLGKSVGERRVLLGRAQQVSDLAGCQIIFVSASESSRLRELLARLHNQPALIVGESEGFASGGGTIQFVLDQNRVRFAINPDAAERTGLKISSKLLALATIVHDSAHDKEARN